jgi:hypothetical protein
MVDDVRPDPAPSGPCPRPGVSPPRTPSRVADGYDGSMSKLLRGVVAGYGASKLGGGCLSTIIIFLLLWWLLGHFGVFQ